MHDYDFAEPRWPGRLARVCCWLTILVAAAWWFASRERPLPPRRNVAILRDPEQRASSRYIATDHLEHAGSSVVPDLIHTLKEGDVLGRELAAIALGRLGPKAGAAADALTKAANDPEVMVRAQAIVALGRMSKVRELAELLTNDEADVRRRAVIEMGEMDLDAEPFLADLHKMLADPDARVRAESYAALRKLSAIGAPEFTAGLTGDPDPIVRRTTVILLARLPDPAPRTFLPALSDADPLVTITALEELGRMGAAAEPIIAAIASLLESRDEKTVQNAAIALARIGPPTSEATGAPIEQSELASTPVDDAGLADIADLTDRVRLDVAHTGITSDGLRHLAGLANLRTLRLSYCNVTDEGLAELANLQSLEELFLDRTLVTDAGMPHLAKLVRLKWLSLWGTKVTDAGLEFLEGLEALEEVAFSPEQVSIAGLVRLPGLTRIMATPKSIIDADLASLGASKRLKMLALSGASISDARMVFLGKLNSLESLFLDEVSITDAGLMEVRRLSNLHTLWLNRIRVSHQALDELRRALPAMVLGSPFGPASTTSVDYEVVGLRSIAGAR